MCEMNKAIINKIILLVAICFFASFYVNGAENPSVNSNRLSVQETIGAAFIRPEDGGLPWNLYSRANPDAKAQLYEILSNPNLKEHHPGVWKILGYIGDTSDVKRIERSLENDYSGILTEQEKTIVRAYFDALGLMSGRDIKEAQALVEKLMKVAYWETAKFRWFPNEVKAKPGFEYEMISLVLKGYSLSGREDMAGMALDIVKSINDPGLREYMQGRVDPTRLAYEAKAVRIAEKKEVSDQDRLLAAGYFDGNLDSPAPVKNPVANTNPKANQSGKSGQDRVPSPALKTEFIPEQDVKFIKIISKEAIEGFEQIKIAVLAGNVDAVIGHLLDDGRIIDEKRLQRSGVEYKEDLEIEQEVFQSLADLKTSPANFKVERNTSYQFSSIAEDGSLIDPTGTEVIAVSFELTGTGEIGKKLFPKRLNNLTISQDGILIVVMKKINDKWYWNPFGW